MVRLNYDILNGLCVDRSIGSDGEEHILEYIKKEVEDLGIQTVSPHRYTMCHGGTVGTGKSKTQTQMHEFASCFFT